MLHERSETQKPKSYVVPFIGNVQYRQIQRNERQVGGYQGLNGWKNGESLLNGYGISFRGDENVSS